MTLARADLWPARWHTRWLRGARRWVSVVVVVLACALVVDAVVAAPFFFSNDGPHHIFSAWARAHLDDPALGYSHFFTGNAPPSANGVADLFAALAPFLGWRAAHQVVVVVIALVWLLGCVALARSLHKERTAIGLLAGSAALGWNLYLGFFEFALASGLGLLTLALANASPPRVSARVAVIALLALTSWVHFFAAALTGMALAVLWFARAPTTKSLAWIAGAAMPAAIPALLAMQAASTLTDVDGSAPWSVRLTALGACTVAGPLWRELPAFACALGSLAILVGTRATRAREELALGALALVFAAAPLLIPWTLFGWQDVAARPCALALALFAALLPVERASPSARMALVGLAFVCCASATLWARALNVRVASENADVLRALEHAPANTGYRWPLILVDASAARDADILRWDPERGLGSLFALVQGGFVAHSHVVNAQAHTVLLRPNVAATLTPPLLRSRDVTPIRALDDGARAHAIDALADRARSVDGIIAIERETDHDVWRARGYAIDLVDGRVLLAHPTSASPTTTPTTPTTP